jgi:hypothetical protein
MRTVGWWLVLALVLALRSSAARGATLSPVGSEFLVETSTSFAINAESAPLAGGGFVVVWQNDMADGSTGILGHRFTSAGSVAGTEFLLNTYTTSDQSEPSIASNASGRFVAVWQSYTQDGDAQGIAARRFASDGTPLGSDFLVNTYTTSAEYGPSVAMDAAGGFVVAWVAYDGDDGGVFGRRFDGAGAALGTEFQTSTYFTGNQTSPAVGGAPDGRFVVVWDGDSQDGSGRGIFGRRYASDGTPAGSEFQVNAYTSGSQRSAAVAVTAAGDFVVAWYGPGADDDYGVFARRFDSSGTASGTECRVNEATTGNQRYPRMAITSDDEFLVVFEGDDGAGTGVLGRRLDSTGAPVGTEFQINTVTSSTQFLPVVAASPLGPVMAVWSSYGHGGGSPRVIGQAFVVPTTTTTTTSASTTTTTHPRSGSQTLSGKRLVLKNAPNASRRALTLASSDRSTTLGGGEGSADDPTSTGATLRLLGTGLDVAFDLPAAGWKRIGKKGRAKGWKYADKRGARGPIRALTLRAAKSLDASGKGAALGVTLATNPAPVDVVLQLGAAGRLYCLRFGGTVGFKSGKTLTARSAGPPGDCPF